MSLGKQRRASDQQRHDDRDRAEKLFNHRSIAGRDRSYVE
jgi:hypothetical protein